MNNANEKKLAIIFVLLTYILTWSIEIPVALTRHGYATINISKVLQTICTLSPGVVALMITAIFHKKTGLITLLKAVLKWKVKFKWYIIVIILSVLLCGLSLVLFNWAYGQTNKPDAVYNFIFYFIIILPLSALWEEIGWRGLLLPVLQNKFTPLKASIIIGFVWGLWHLPIYLALDPYGANTIYYFLFMFIGCFAISILQTWLYNSTNGSVFICIILHNAINTSAAYFYGNLKNAEFRPFIIWIVLLALTATYIGFKTKGELIEKGELA
jgi:membrane protease YdiL (CAAX protease family)